MYTAITQGVKVSVEANYEIHLSDPDRLNNIFSYHVLIENVGSAPVKLIRRHWIIVDCLHAQREVEGDGVIGEQPLIDPEQYHEYESWCSLHGEVGKMWGTYLFQNCLTGQEFLVDIPVFHLVTPYKLN
ncbi:MAG: Co2+/Mg2+ efflux protein ApaG [Flavobacteriales bacterium]|nr:Co2+/Mg2+ efflux protein ApaG [Flavobacteriales bacterium]